MPNTVLGSGNSVVDQAPDLMEFTFWWWGKDNKQVAHKQIIQAAVNGMKNISRTLMKCDERLLQSGTKEDLWELMTCELRFKQEGANL